ncbi:MAG: TAXI family TRAP transporter solute-binding subunit [Rhodospirillales bacterium]|jgi:hypothetical protein|nr:hypothetical protein [Rhodospirillaceae bacterium]MDP6427525.1 TAXI family TRAP transporter solute-binding subunit [Rhodospirillales bacterium]MDP6646285.1 TAXI family TRAP transporter solute-binding subunit [Rhodospirillales bacterium]MDP6842550.1 TAXI family TRAP transporter solute-binding subunit [Rhodospirillales bacterium]
MTQFLKCATLALLAAAAPATAFAQTLGFATLQPGAINHVQAQIISKVVQTATGMQVRVLPMRGTAAVLSAVHSKHAEFSVGTASHMTTAVLGTHDFKGRAKVNLRVAFTALAFPIGIMVRNNSSIKTVADMKGRRFPTGWKAFPNGIPLANGVLAAAGLSLADMESVPTSGLIPAANDFKVGKNDGTTFAVGAPKVAEINAAIKGGLRFLSMDNSPAALARVKKVRPDYFIMTLKPNPRFAGILGPTNVLGVNLVITAGAHVSNDTMYKFVKAVAENKAALAKGHPSFNGFFPDKRMAKQYSSVRYHPGSIKYFKEKGIWPGK